MLLGLQKDWHVPDRHFCPATPASGERTLHLYYSLLGLQKEIEKRTFYLGKYRTPQDKEGNNGVPPHLLDLIGMSRDESDVLYPFAKKAMADVFSELSHASVGLPKLYHWEDKVNSATIRRRRKDKFDLQLVPDFNYTIQTDYVKIFGGLLIDQDYADLIQTGSEITNVLISEDIIRPNIYATIKYKTTRRNISTGEEILTDYEDMVLIDASHISLESFTFDTSVEYAFDYYYPIKLKKQDGKFTQEEIEDGEIFLSGGVKKYWEFTKNVETIKSGMQFTISNNEEAPVETMYKAKVDFTENDLPARLHEVAEVVENGEVIEEGIHYYIGYPDYFNDSLVGPLDTAISEALVDRIIWHWLVLSYPAEAQTWDTLYQSDIAAIKSRSYIFHKNWVERTPRIY